MGSEDAAEHALTEGSATFDHPEVGQLVDPDGRRCTATLITADVVVTAAHCVQQNPYAMNEGGFSGTFHVDLGPRDRRSYRTFFVAAYGGAFDIALVRLAGSVPPSVAKPTPLATRAPRAGEALTRFGYGCTDKTTRAGSNVKRKHAFVHAPPTVVSDTCFGDSGGPTIGENGIYMITSGESASGTYFALTYENHAPLAHKLSEWDPASPLRPAPCPNGTGPVRTCSADTKATVRCLLGWVEEKKCTGACLAADFDEEDADCEEDVR
jgi:hypothetical protein